MVVMWLGFFRLTAGFQSDTKMHQLMTPKTGTALNLYFTSAFIFGCVVSHGAVMPGDDFNANTTTGASTLQRWYNHKGLWDTTGWWNAANCVEAVENAIVANNGQSYLDVISNTFNLNAAGGFLNDYYDDEGWWALAWIRAYDLTGNIQYLSMAKTIFKDMTGGWNDHCDGGLGWRKSRPSKNAVQNELFLLVAIRLHQRTPGDGGAGSYFDWAIREWDWFKHSGLINSQNLVNDGLNRNCENNGRTTWTYNQGVIIGGLTDLYKTTGDSNYLAQATAIADATISTLIDKHGVLREPCESGDCGGGDTPQFKGIFIRYLACLYDETHNPAYLDFLLNSARSVWANDRDDTNHLGLKWSGPFDQADAARHSSAMMAVSALAEPATKFLPFAKGAGSVTFNHAVGEAAGPLAWNCSAANAANAGFMLSGTCASLAVGKHIIHFRMAVNEMKNSTDNLVRLDVKETNKETALASQQVPWNSFTATGQPQDFQLDFTNATASAPLEYQVYWNGVANAPSLTLSDVTVDGSHNWIAANLAHEIGRLDGFNSWEADPIRDHVSGYLVKGPGAKEFPTGNYSACFELKVDNFNWDKLKVATLSIVDSDTGNIIASSEVARNQFPNMLYHTFTLDFRVDASKRYDFRTFWHYAPNAPRLTQRSLVVQSQTPSYPSNQIKI
jgi:predicted alpha-1,6-mannanase (GH76 family)